MKVRYLICGIIFALAGITTAAPLLNIFEGIASPADSEISSRIFENDTTSYVKVDELYDDAAGKMNATNVDTLLKYITGNENASIQTNLRTTMEGLDNLATAVTTSAEIRQNVLTTTPQQKSSEQDVIVTLGGLDWQVVYLSRDDSGNNILTLWLANSTDTSTWSSGWSSSSTDGYPSNMYGTSYIRAVTLNNGGQYATSNTALTTSEQSASNKFARFTMEDVENSLAKFIVTPSEVNWQQYQSAAVTNPSERCYNPNDSLNDPADIGLEGEWVDSSYNYTDKEGYSAWANDYIWLPSVAETGYSTSDIGLWETSTAQRQNISSSGSFSWLRSGLSSNVPYAYYLYSSGSNCNVLSADLSYAVRPALHLNLNSVALSATSGAEGASGVNDLALTHAYIENQTVVEGEAVTPTPDIYFGDTLLVDGENYEISSYENNTAEGVGKMTITAVEGGGYVGEKTFAFVIGENLPDMANAEITYDETAVEWTGSAVTKDVSVSYYGTVLQEGVDYALSFSNNTNIGATAAINIRGLGFYQNAQTAYFSIVRRSMTAENRIQVEGFSDMTYTGSALTPEFTVTDTELDMQLQSGRDFSITFHRTTADGEVVENPTDAGTYYIVLQGINNYSGVKSTSFVINQGIINSDAVTLAQNSFTFNRQNVTLDITVRVNNRILLENEYSLEIRKNSTSGEIVEPTEIVDAGTYYVTVRANNNNYTGYGTKSFVINQASVAGGTLVLADAGDGFVYAGTDVEPQVQSVSTNFDNNSLTLQEGEYSVSYSNNNGAGTAYVTVRGTGNFTGTLQQAFTILPKELEYSMLGELGTYSYTGFDVEPEVVLTYNNMPLGKDIDFSVSYSNNLNASDNALITISAVDNGNYSGSIEATFSITRLSLENAQVGGYLAEYAFNDTEIKPEFSITVAGYFEEDQETLKTLVSGVDFEVQWPDDCKNVGVKEVTIIGINNFSYLTSVEFEIVATNIESLTIEGFEESLPYNHGDGVTQNLVLKLGDNVIGSENYVISYQNNINAGETAELYITPSNANLTGEISRTFDIEKAAPVLNFVENLSGFDGDNLNELTVLGEGCTEGVLTFEQDSLMLGTTTYNYTFTPTDMDNYEIATGSIEIQVNTVELVGIEAESGRLVSGNVFDTSSVRVFGLYNNGARLEIQITECEVSISSGSTLAYGQNVTIRYAGFDTTLVVLRDSIQNNGFTVSSDIGIDEGVEFEVEIVDELIGIYEIIGEYYENYGNVEQIFVTTLTKDGEAYTDDRLVVTFDTATVQGNFVYYSLVDGKLVQLDVSGGTINFGSDGNIILALEVYSDFTMWIIIGAICLFALIIVVFVILLALRNRKKKRKKMSTSSNADSENFEQK